MAKLTRWFPATVKPVHSGVYLTTSDLDLLDASYGGAYRFWNGQWWGFYGETAAEAKRKSGHEWVSATQGYHWRGLAKEPK